ncbi:hypothetical protein EX895_001527 [Sporisorium graminicola]|uniref:Cytochrome P450 n=1 Tax=Sporisorium graminicola TaxID=280036 RepID=A0A4U7L325_9BASI|nr:hypothetical protein EX895_001525 [Sporisorium graminicola]XP_029741727.1 hypothetical protein EX895_001527 [Sporisorium graminicola]TKY89740.1 hypothetical protein EX895_001525 [Sporisorium graminicola]TKY89742.1 hypothetical protein EX895_001527 [Sporisorium graminicola]
MIVYLSNFRLLRRVDLIPTTRKRTTEATSKKLEEVSAQIVDRKKNEIRSEMQAEVQARGEGQGIGFTKDDFDEKDSSAAGAGISGANQTAWTLWLLAQNPHIQTKLRAEIHDQFGTDMERDPGYDELMSMEFLDAVCKKSFRVKSAVPDTIRVANTTADVPLSKAYPTCDGKSTVTSVQIPKGLEFIVPMQVINFDTDIWGPDAAEFNPQRWRNPTTFARQSGLPMHLMTFISGPRGCIGNRFALAEFKAMLAHLVGNFHFEEVEGW